MSDIYDYVYAHVSHCPEEAGSSETTTEKSTTVFERHDEIYNYGTTAEDSKSQYEVNTVDFTTLDLQTFVDSLEVIARLERAKVNDKPSPEEVYSNGATVEVSNSLSAINTADFSPQDLQMFVDCLEAIARLEQAKIKAKPKTKAMKPTKARRKIQVTCLDTSTCESLYEDDVNRFSNLSWPSTSEYLYDETYCEIPHCVQSTAMYSNVMSNTVPDTSGSDDTGVFHNDAPEGHLYENIEPLKPKSKLISFPKIKSLKSRLISLFLKKRFGKPQKPGVEILSTTKITQQSNANEIYERILDDVIKEQLESEKSKKNKKKPSGKKSKETIISKALRILTL